MSIKVQEIGRTLLQNRLHKKLMLFRFWCVQLVTTVGGFPARFFFLLKSDLVICDRCTSLTPIHSAGIDGKIIYLCANILSYLCTFSHLEQSVVTWSASFLSFSSHGYVDQHLLLTKVQNHSCLRCRPANLSNMLSVASRWPRHVVAKRVFLCSSALPETPQTVDINGDEDSKKLAILECDTFKNVDVKDASEYLALFVGRCCGWNKKGIAWRLYAPRISHIHGQPGIVGNPFGLGTFTVLGREISSTEALHRLEQGKTIRVQRMRVAAFLPTLQSLENIIETTSPLAASLLGGSTAALPNTPGNYIDGCETRFGLPTSLSSFAELKLFSLIYNQSINFPPPSPDDSPSVLKQKQIAETIRALKTRSLESGMYFYTYEGSILRRFIYDLGRKLMFWTPVFLVGLVGLTSSTSVMSFVGLETIPLFSIEDATQLASLPEPAIDVNVYDPVQTGAEIGAATVREVLDYMKINGSVHVAFAAAIATSVARSFSQIIYNPSGYQICSYSAFKKVARGERMVLQERVLRNLRIPFGISLHWFVTYRPAEFCSSLEDLTVAADLYLSTSKQVLDENY